MADPVNPGATLYPDGGNDPAGNPGAAVDPATGAQKFGDAPLDPKAQVLPGEAAPEPAKAPEDKPAEPAPQEPPKEPPKEGEGETPVVAAVPIESYKDLALPKEFEVSEETMGKFKTAASELGIAPEGAKRMLDLYAEVAQTQMNNLVEAVKANDTKTRESWVGELKSMPEFQGEALERTQTFLGRIMDEFGTPELGQYLNQTGLGDHPGLVKLILGLGTALIEGDPTPPGDPGKLAGPKPNGQGQRRTPGSILYDNPAS